MAAETMSCEVPCVATDVGDTRAVTGAAGEVARLDDREMAATALEPMVRLSPAMRRGVGAIAREHIASRHHSISASPERCVRLYAPLVSYRKLPSCAA